MTAIHHHPGEETLARFASGTLAAGPALVVEIHLAACAACRSQVAALEAVAAAFVQELPLATMSDDALARVFARAEKPAVAVAGATREPAASALLPGGAPRPAALAERAVGRWWWIGRGARLSMVQVPEDKTSTVFLLWGRAGTRFPGHGHFGTELTHVLTGSYSDGFGTFAAGDLLEAGPETDHQPVVDPGGDCICIAALDSAVRFRGWLGHVLGPFTRPAMALDAGERTR